MTKQLYKEHPGEQRNHVKMQSITFNLTEITYKEVNCGFLQLSTFLSFSLWIFIQTVFYLSLGIKL